MKSKNKNTSSAYERARKRIKDIKGFYGHLTVYVIINAVVLFTRARFIFTVPSKETLGDPAFLNWLDWNTYGTTIVWGIVLGIHAFNVFVGNPFLGKAWEERQIEKYMKRDESPSQTYK